MGKGFAPPPKIEYRHYYCEVKRRMPDDSELLLGTVTLYVPSKPSIALNSHGLASITATRKLLELETRIKANQIFVFLESDKRFIDRIELNAYDGGEITEITPEAERVLNEIYDQCKFQENIFKVPVVA